VGGGLAVPRIRSIKPEFFRNEQLAELPLEDRLLFIGLWTQADRAGRLEDRPKRLRGELFPYDDLDVDAGLGRLANAGLITRYEVNSQRLIAIPTWAKHQRPHATEAASTLAPPDGVEDITVRAPLDNRYETLGREGKGIDQEGKEQELRAGFDALWAVYPRKVGKDAALAEFVKIKPDGQLVSVMVGAVERQCQSPQWRKDGGQFIPHPRTWLKQGRWKDSVDLVDTKPMSDFERQRDANHQRAIAQQIEYAKRREQAS